MKLRPTTATLAIAGMGLMIGVAAPARATVLLNLINPATQTNTPYSLSFVAGSASTTVSIEGYESPYQEESTDNGLFLGGAGPNLLGQTWAFTPAAADSYAIQYSDGTSVNALLFGGYMVGDYDIFSQTIATTPGRSYTLDFLFSNEAYNGFSSPSGFIVAATDPLPEPTSIMLLGVGLFGLRLIHRKRG